MAGHFVIEAEMSCDTMLLRKLGVSFSLELGLSTMVNCNV